MKRDVRYAWIPGQPETVTHQSGTRITGHRTYKTKRLLEWEKKLEEALQLGEDEEPMIGSIKLQVTFGFKAPRKKDLWKWKLTRPDTDNMMKTLKDVMTRCGWWTDDSQVVVESCKKMYVDSPGVVIHAHTINKELWLGINQNNWIMERNEAMNHAVL